MKLKTLISAIFLSFLLSVTAFAATSDSVNMLQMYENIKTEYGMGYTAPFDARTKVEDIDESTGSVYVRETDLTVPGVNGLDFNLVRSFNSQSISANYEYYKNGFGKREKKR